MAINFPESPGTLLLCDYSTGFREPEMVKRRPAIVISPRLRHRTGLCTVVPLSTSAPQHDVTYSCRIDLPQPLPKPFESTTVWAKADMLATVSFQRLDLFRTERDQYGKRQYLKPRLSPEDLARVRHAILNALGIVSLTSVTAEATFMAAAPEPSAR